MVSKVTAADIIQFIAIEDPDANDVREIEAMQAAALAFIYGYTGLTAEQADKYQDLEFALMVLVQDMYDNRARYVDKATLNQTAESILNLHAGALV